MSSSHMNGIARAVGADGWDPDAELGVGAQKQEREWDIMVVNDPKMVNAQAVPGDRSRFSLVFQLFTGHRRSHYSLHRNSTCLSRRTRAGRRARPW